MIDKLNGFALERIQRYQNLDVFGHRVNTPYFINNVGRFLLALLSISEVPEEFSQKVHENFKAKKIPFGWERGKGTPEQIEKAAREISRIADIKLVKASPEGISEFMKLFGLGIDCSGFVFHTLYYAFERTGMLDEFLNSLAWTNPEKMEASKAGAFIFAGEASRIIQQSELRTLDLLLIRAHDFYNHIAMVVEKDGRLFLAQSNLDCIPTGVNLSEMSVENNRVVFNYQSTMGEDWNTYFDAGMLEYRRLKVLDE